MNTPHLPAEAPFSSPHIQMSLNAAEPFLSVSEKPSLPSPRSRKPSRLVTALSGACLVAACTGAAVYFKQRSLRGTPSHDLSEVDLDTTCEPPPSRSYLLVVSLQPFLAPPRFIMYFPPPHPPCRARHPRHFRGGRAGRRK